MSTLPNFLYVGAAKAGSTWIERSLREHPQVYIPPTKDIFFFDKQYHRGMAWYSAHFRPRPGHAAIGELSHDYFLHRETLERIQRDLPGVRLIVCLRDPVTRLFSRYIYQKSVDDLGNMGPLDYADLPDIAAESAYLRNLTNIYSLFPRERVLVLFHEDLRTDSAAFIERIYSFLGVRTDFLPSTLNTVILGAQRARFPSLTYAAFAVSRLLREAGLANLVGWLKRRTIIDRLLFTPYDARPSLSLADALALYERYEPEYEALEELIGRPLPSQWRRHGVGVRRSRGSTAAT